jgi:predicted RNase H-like HicB family nuclease
MRRLQNYYIYLTAATLRKFGLDFNVSGDKNVGYMRRTIAVLDHHAIEFEIEQYPDGSWAAESKNLDGIITGSRDIREAPELLKDAIFTYFEIPPHLCADNLLWSDNEPAMVEQTVHVGA